METNEQPHLARNLKSRHVQLIAIGGTIGTGLFLGSGESIHFAGPSILLAYLITGIICFWLMRALGELLLSDLDHTSFVDFIRDYLGNRASFIIGWTYWMCWITLAMSEVTALGLYMQFWFPHLPQWIPGLIILVILLSINLITVALFGETEFWFALIKIIAIIALIVTGIFLILIHFKTTSGYVGLNNLVNHGGIFPRGLKGFCLSFQMVVFSFVGVEMVGMTASETADPQHVIPKAINSIPLRIILFYVGSLFVIMCIYPWNKVATNSSPFVQVFGDLGIKAAAGIINFVVITAAASACNSALYTTGRMLFSLAIDSKNKYLHKIGHLSRRQVPQAGLIVSTIIIAIAVILNMFMPNGVFTLVSSIATTCFLFVWASIIGAHLRYRHSSLALKSNFKMPLTPWSDYLVLIFLAFLMIVLCCQKSTLIALILSCVWLLIINLIYQHSAHK
ncbi:MAG: amino acid permease [Candidatus Paralactobacillus gallistercoris]|uniref:Amino acid permease n=1 Tax=Candidatus Paralactobacillus gallistercoris TaxID=2838724 RepID=A0A948TK52_9LACO|nr:amino acid permease [Candidatus Paralactobacillus gallistercoris]